MKTNIQIFIKKLFKNILNKLNIELNSDTLLYLYSNDALPSPLESEEELDLILKASSGDENAKASLIEHNLRLVVYISKKFENTDCDLEDLISIGSVGLIKAIESFNLEKNIKLATFASRCIENEILMYLRKTVKLKNEISLDEPLTHDSDGNELVLADIIATDKDEISENLENSVEKKLLYNSIKKLNAREKQIMYLRYGLGDVEEKTQKEVADMLGISQSYISRIEKKVLNKLKSQMAKVL